MIIPVQELGAVDVMSDEERMAERERLHEEYEGNIDDEGMEG